MANSIFSIRKIKGYDDTSTPTAVADDQCIIAENVAFNLSELGERRLGCVDIDLPVAITGDVNIQAITFLHRHLPTTDETASELWVLGQHLTSQFLALIRKTTTWATATFTSESIDVTSNRGFQVAAQTLHGKLFLAFRSVGGVNRLHVVDSSGTAVRRTGLAEPAAPTAVNFGSGTYAGTRYFRVRYTVQSAGVTLRRSEPSDTLTFVPSGTGAGARITKPASISESETHWEVEGSTDNSNFYRIATVVVGTTTFDDSTEYVSGYANVAGAVLSEDAGDYSLIHSGKFLSADEDRLLIGGSWEDDKLASRVSWTPVFNDPGVGNDERIPTDTDNFLDLDGFEGGPLTALSNPINGYIHAFKTSAVYRLVRSGIRSRAYNAFVISKTYGALPGSVVEGTDGVGRPCLYALDPNTGPYRIGEGGLQSASRDILTTWGTINTDAIIVSRALYDPINRHVHWWVTTSGNFPNLELVLQTNETVDTKEGVRSGWAKWTGKISRAYATTLYAENIDNNVARSLVLRPFIGVTAADGYVLRTDTGNDDNGTAYAARIKTKPYILRDLLSKFGILAAALLAKAHATADINVTLIRDLGLEEPRTVETDLVASGSETDVIKQLRNLTGSQMYALQLDFEDVAAPTGQWQLNRFDCKISPQETA